MKIGNIDTRKYKACQLKATFSPPTDGVAYEWPDRYLLPLNQTTTQRFGACQIEMGFKGNTRNEITRAISDVLGLLGEPVYLTLDGYKGKYYALLQKAKSEKTIAATYYKLSLEFAGFMTDTPVLMEYDSQTTATIHRMGSRCMPCKIVLTATKDTEKFTLSGFGKHDIVVYRLSANVPVTIDGASGLATQAGTNKMPDIDMWEFPQMDATEKTLTWTPADVKVGVEYTPAWL